MIKFIAGIGKVIKVPYRILKLIFHVPNVRILYRSGNSQSIFLKNVEFTADSATGIVDELKWHTLYAGKPVFANVKEIEAIFMLW